jgi:hypothetical protein
MIVDIQVYLSTFDQWLSQHIYIAVKSGKDLAFRDRRFNSILKLDEDGAAWDYVMLEPGSPVPPGGAWSVYRLHGVQPNVARLETVAPKRRNLIEYLTQAAFGARRAGNRPNHLRLVH